MRNREVGTKHVFAGGTRLVSKLVKQPVDTDGDGQPDPIANCNNPPWGWTNGNGNPGGNSGNCPGAGGNGGGNGGGGGSFPEVFEKDQYYYHPDHLGTSSYVTDLDGELFQHLEYFPFGETWVEEHSNTQRTPYLFTAKELDEETGLYYFGARYYDPRTSVWQSPDPILADYISARRGEGGVYRSANLALYSYTHLNPIKYLDPNGEEPNKSQAITWDQARTIITQHFESRKAEPALQGLRYTSGAEGGGGQVGPFGGNTGGRYVWTENRGWIDLGHMFQAAAVADEKVSESWVPKWAASTLARGTVNDRLMQATIRVEEGQSGETKWSYEDAPSNLAGSDFYLDYYSDDASMMDALDNFFKDAGAGPVESAPNWNEMKQNAGGDRPQFPENRTFTPFLTREQFGLPPTE